MEDGLVAFDTFDQSLEIEAEVRRTPSGNYNIHIQGIYGVIEIPVCILMDIAKFAEDEVSKDEAKQAAAKQDKE